MQPCRLRALRMPQPPRSRRDGRDEHRREQRDSDHHGERAIRLASRLGRAINLHRGVAPQASGEGRDCRPTWAPPAPAEVLLMDSPASPTIPGRRPEAAPLQLQACRP